MEHENSLPLTAERLARRKAREAARKKRTRAQRRRRLRLLIAVLLPLLLLAAVLITIRSRHASAPADPPAEASQSEVQPLTENTQPPVPAFAAHTDDSTVTLGEDFPSHYAVLMDAEDGRILAQKDADAVISPASMTKILTLLVAAEQLTDLDQTFTMTVEITDYCFRNDCSVVGYQVGETATVRELLYGTILSSGADAALGLACTVSGSQEAFVALMNEKLEELGLSATAHVTNCVGIYDPEHHCTVKDMALILRAALENPLCREVLSAKKYPIPATEAHREGQVLSNWFLRRIEDKDTGSIEVIGAKTGYVTQSGSCAASCGETPDGHTYLCVTGDAHSAWRAIYDHVDLYKTYCN